MKKINLTGEGVIPIELVDRSHFINKLHKLMHSDDIFAKRVLHALSYSLEPEAFKELVEEPAPVETVLTREHLRDLEVSHELFLHQMDLPSDRSKDRIFLIFMCHTPVPSYYHSNSKRASEASFKFLQKKEDAVWEYLKEKNLTERFTTNFSFMIELHKPS